MEPSSQIAGLVPEILDRIDDAIVVVDLGGTIAFVNTSAAELFGYAPAQLVGASIEVLVPDASRATHERMRVQYRRLPAARPMGSGLPLEARRADGQVFEVDIRLEPVQDWVVASVRPTKARSSGERALLDTLETLGQHLFAAGMSMAALRNSLPAAATARIDDTTEILDRTLEYTRQQHAAHSGD